MRTQKFVSLSLLVLIAFALPARAQLSPEMPPEEAAPPMQPQEAATNPYDNTITAVMDYGVGVADLSTGYMVGNVQGYKVDGTFEQHAKAAEHYFGYSANDLLTTLNSNSNKLDGVSLFRSDSWDSSDRNKYACSMAPCREVFSPIDGKIVLVGIGGTNYDPDHLWPSQWPRNDYDAFVQKRDADCQAFKDAAVNDAYTAGAEGGFCAYASATPQGRAICFGGAVLAETAKLINRMRLARRCGANYEGPGTWDGSRYNKDGTRRY